jgi:hypothetical protein
VRDRGEERDEKKEIKKEKKKRKINRGRSNQISTLLLFHISWTRTIFVSFITNFCLNDFFAFFATGLRQKRERCWPHKP